MLETGPQTAPQTAPQGPLLTATTAPQAANDDAEELKKKVPFLLFFRTSFHQNLLSKNADKSWQMPDQNDFLDQNKNKFSITKDNDGCEFTLKDETVQFQLINNSLYSHTAFRHCIESYVDSYGKWREKCNKKDDKSLDLIFELTVYDEAQIKPILAALEATGQTLNKIKIINPATNELRELTTAQEIEPYSSKPRANAPTPA